MKAFFESLLRTKQMVFLVHDLALTALSAALAEVGPLSFSPGLARVSGGQWLGVLDHTGAVVIVTLSALVGTPLTRRYGVGAAVEAVPPSAAVPSPQ